MPEELLMSKPEIPGTLQYVVENCNRLLSGLLDRFGLLISLTQLFPILVN